MAHVKIVNTDALGPKPISSFWTKSMRRKIAAHGDAGLDELPREALRRLASQSGPAASNTEPKNS